MAILWERSWCHTRKLQAESICIYRQWIHNHVYEFILHQTWVDYISCHLLYIFVDHHKNIPTVATSWPEGARWHLKLPVL